MTSEKHKQSHSGLSEDDIKREAEEISRKIWEEEMQQKPKKKWFANHSPLVIALSFGLAMIIIFMAVPYYGIRMNPEPRNVPAIQDVLPPGFSVVNETIKINSRADYLRFIDPQDAQMKQIASRIAATSCAESNQLCHAKALFYFVRDNVHYISDPEAGSAGDYVEHPTETLFSGAADCDGHAVLLFQLMNSIGVPARFAFVPGHVFIQIWLDDAPRTYRQKDGWINLDATCKDCRFGDLSYKTQKQAK